MNEMVGDRDIVACPRCGSGRIVSLLEPISSGERYDACMDCRALWEPIPVGEKWMRDGELLAFRSPCDNCAFRAGSPESRDRPSWRNLLLKLRIGGDFFCHKGVPLDAKQGPGNFEFPRDATGNWDRNQMRLCRGFLNAWARWQKLPPLPAGTTHVCTIDENAAGEPQGG